jgi:hypothetical protein
MNAILKYQIRIRLDEHLADLARRDPGNPALEPLNAVLIRHDAHMKCQYDAFMDYVNDAESQGIERYPLYEWTKETVENPVKKDKHLAIFTIYAGGEEVYPKETADAIQAALAPLVDGATVLQLMKYDTDPERNPQPPAR